MKIADVQKLEKACPLSKNGKVLGHFHCESCGACPGVKNTYQAEGGEIAGGFYNVFITRRSSKGDCGCKDAPMYSLCPKCAGKIREMVDLPEEFEAKGERMLRTIRVAFGLAPLSTVLPEGSRARKNLENLEALHKQLNPEPEFDDKRFHKAVLRFAKLHFGKNSRKGKGRAQD